MNPDPQTLAQRVFLRVLEDYAFLFGDDTGSGEVPANIGPCLQAAMIFDGPLCGHLAIAAPETFAHEVAANVLGLETDDPQAMASAHDALKELLNVTCGNLLTELAGEQPIFDLTVPEITPMTPDEWQHAAAGPWTLCQAGDWPVLLAIQLESPSPTTGNFATP